MSSKDGCSTSNKVNIKTATSPGDEYDKLIKNVLGLYLIIY